MRHISIGAIAAVLLLTTPAVAPAAQAAAATAPVPGSADARLKALYDAEWAWREKEMAREPGEEGRGASADHMPRVDAATQQRRLDYWTNVLAELDKIPRDQLSAEERVNADVFETILTAFVNDIRFKTYEAPFNSDSFFWTGFTPREG